MNKLIIVVCLFLIACCDLLAQSDSSKIIAINSYTYSVDTAKQKEISFSFKLDSIIVKVKGNRKRIETNNYFDKSKSIIDISFYLKNDSLLLVNVRERSPKFPDMYSNSLFYFDKDKILDEQYRTTIRPCMLIPKDKSIYELYGYNQYLSTDFIKNYLTELLNRIKATKRII